MKTGIMAKGFAVAVGIVVSSFTAAYGNIGKDRAASIAETFYKNISGRASDAVCVDLSGNPDCIVFNMSEGGFVVVSTVDSDSPVIGYGLTGTLAAETVAPAFKASLDNYSLQPARSKSAEKIISRSDRPAEVAPLLGDIAWDQLWPYNLLTPEIDGQHCPTGCSATGMAQVMRYYKYPAHGTGKISYEMWNGETISADLEKSTYDWDLMKPTYGWPTENDPTAEELAVAVLMRDAGYACATDYHLEYSGGAGAAKSLIEHFGYDRDARALWKREISRAAFKDVIRDELAQGRPVFFSANAHFYICDGYDANGLFHFNYGWSGSGNGFFEVDAYAPDYLELSINYGIQPDKGGQGVYTGASGRGFIWNGTTLSLNYTLWTFDENMSACLGLAYRNLATSQIIYSSDLSGMTGTMTDYNTTLEYDCQLADGEYEVFPVYRDIRSDKWCEFYFADGAQTKVHLDVRNGERKYTNVAPEGTVYLGNLVYTVSESDATASLVSFITSDESYGLNKIEIPASIDYNGKQYPVTNIAPGALQSHPGTVDLTIGCNVESFGELAFAYVTFENLRFADGSKLTKTGSNTFVNCTFKSPIILPDGLREVGWNSFGGSQAEKIDIPESVEAIDGSALDFFRLKDIYVHWDSPLECTEIFGWMDYPNDLATAKSQITLHVPAGTKSKYEAASPWNLVYSIVDDSPESGIDDIVSGATDDATVTVYNLQGIRLYDRADRSCLHQLPAGIYIINGRLVRL